MFFDDSTPERRKKAAKLDGSKRYRQLGASPIPPAKPYELFGLDEILHGDKTLIYDVESYSNYFEVGFKCAKTGKIIYFEDTPEGYFVNGFAVEFNVWANFLSYIIHRCLIIGFYSRVYDLPMLLVALQGARGPALKEVSDNIVFNDLQAYEVERKYGVRAPHVNHIDIIEVAPIQASLKIYGGRLHCERMQDLPYPHDSILTPEQARNVRDYNINDLDVTHLLYDHIKPHIEMREILGREYEQDLRSKSDAQIAEAIISYELEKLGKLGAKPNIESGFSFYYKVPDYISFKTAEFQHALEVIRETPFIVGNGGSAACPDIIDQLKPKLGNGVYRLGVGGLHSSEESVYYEADDETYIIDRDVASYYPYIILNNRLYPQHLGEDFLEVYRGIVMRRLKLKKEKNPLEAGLKIAINGTFGKLGNFYSRMYSPDLLLQVCMTGQLCLLMLIEAIELIGISVVSANTDGIVIRCPKNRYKDLEREIIIWEENTGFTTEETRYKGIYSRDVNNYIAVKENGELKTKGVYCEKGSAQNSVLSKNPESLICSEAVQQFLANKTPITETILNCRDIRKFVTVRTVKGGGEKDGVYLGKAVRWIYSKGETGTINYALSGNKVAKSEGARPLMILPTVFPADIDFDRYIADAEEMLYDLGIYVKPEKAKLI